MTRSIIPSPLLLPGVVLLSLLCCYTTHALPFINVRSVAAVDDWDRPVFGPFNHFSRLAAIEKKSDPSSMNALGDDFMSAMNGASRLRYGKRSGGGIFVDSIPVVDSSRLLHGWAPASSSAKRMSAFSSDSLPASLVDSLNGAERLRFG